MKKKFIYVSIGKIDTTRNNDESFIKEYCIQEDEFIRWASRQMNLGWVIKCKATFIICTPGKSELPKVMLIREVEKYRD